MSMSRRSLLAAGAGLAVAAPALAQARYVIGHNNPFEPFAYVEEGKSKGLLIEIVAESLASGEVRFAWKPLPLERVEGELQGGHIQAIGFTGVTPARRQALDFSKTLVVTGAAIFARADSNAPTDVAAYRGRTVVTPALGPLAQQIRQQHPEVRVMTVDTYEQSLEAVLAHRADAAALNFQVGIRLVRSRFPGRFDLPVRPYAEVPLAFAVAKGKHAELLEAFERGHNLIEIDGRKDEIVARWSRG